MPTFANLRNAENDNSFARIGRWMKNQVDHNHYNSASGDHAHQHQIPYQSIQLRYFSLEVMDWPTNMVIPIAAGLLVKSGQCCITLSTSTTFPLAWPEPQVLPLKHPSYSLYHVTYWGRSFSSFYLQEITYWLADRQLKPGTGMFEWDYSVPRACCTS